ncbi:Phosphoribosyl-ATP pyrophosphatase [Candidatus Roizmanbacteria bacterium]|nr:Phosphoribosyl-ATP pyrophosphatase [Candidatus Roizmanbacteria bacterium]
MKINKLLEIIKDRKIKMPEGSYVASLFELGEDRIIQKVGEEATEVVIAAKNKNKKRIISEVSDLIFHLLVLLVLSDITLSDIEKELESRNR